MLFSLGFAPFDLWFLTIISLSLYLYLLKDVNKRQSLVIGFFYGVGIWLIGISWVYVSIHYHGNIHIINSLFLTMLLVLCLSIYISLHALVYSFFRTHKVIDALLVFPSSWLGLEIIRESAFTGFPWLIAGTALGGSFLDGWIPIIGATGTTIFLLMLSGCLYLLFLNWKDGTSLFLPSFLLIIISLSGYVTKFIEWTNHQDEILVSIYQPNLTLQEKWSFIGIKKTKILFEKALDSSDFKEIIVFPETALILNESDQAEWLEGLGKIAKNKEVGLITGLIERTNNPGSKETSIKNRVKGFGEAEGSYDKIKLVPFGEFIPFRKYIGKILDILNLKLTNTSPGSSISHIRSGNAIISPSICYEVAFGNFIRKSAIGSNILLTISNDTWFGSSIGPYQHLEIAQNRAIEHQKALIRSTNSGISSIIDKKGKILLKQGFFEKKSIKSKVFLNKGTTLFARIGYLPIYLYLIISFIIISYINRTKVLKLIKI